MNPAENNAVYDMLAGTIMGAGGAVIKVTELAVEGKIDLTDALDIGDIVMLCEVHKVDMLQFLSQNPDEAAAEIHAYRNEFKRRALS